MEAISPTISKAIHAHASKLQARVQMGSRTLRLSRARKPQRGTSGAIVLVVKGAWYIFLALDLLRLPGRPMLQHGVEYGQKLMHTRRQGHFFDLPRREEPFAKGFDPRVVTRGHEGAHVEHGAHVRAASPDYAPTPDGPTVAIDGCHANQRRNLLARARPQRGECQQQRASTHGPNARGTL